MLNNWQKSDLFTDKERVALEYAEAVTLRSNAIDEGLLERLKKYFDDDAIVELTALIAFLNLSSKFNSALGVPPGFSAASRTMSSVRAASRYCPGTVKRLVRSGLFRGVPVVDRREERIEWPRPESRPSVNGEAAADAIAGAASLPAAASFHSRHFFVVFVRHSHDRGVDSGRQQAVSEAPTMVRSPNQRAHAVSE